jgi:SAM-dependent methyltransferase
VSIEDLRKLTFETDFDLVFCGSLLTHLPHDGAQAALAAVARALSPTGLALVTFQGRHAEHIQRHKWKYLEDALFAVAERQVRKNGFGFIDYRGDFRSRFSAQARYGVALVRPSWAVHQIETNPELRLLSYAERAWGDHQDVLVFGRPGVDAE